MAVSINGVPNSWLVFDMKNPKENGWWGAYPYFRKPPYGNIPHVKELNPHIIRPDSRVTGKCRSDSSKWWVQLVRRNHRKFKNHEKISKLQLSHHSMGFVYPRTVNRIVTCEFFHRSPTLCGGQKFIPTAGWSKVSLIYHTSSSRLCEIWYTYGIPWNWELYMVSLIWSFPKMWPIPKWMVYQETPMKLDDLGVHLF